VWCKRACVLARVWVCVRVGVRACVWACVWVGGRANGFALRVAMVRPLSKRRSLVAALMASLEDVTNTVTMLMLPSLQRARVLQ
jgi:hypothetical protein